MHYIILTDNNAGQSLHGPRLTVEEGSIKLWKLFTNSVELWPLQLLYFHSSEMAR